MIGEAISAAGLTGWRWQSSKRWAVNDIRRRRKLHQVQAHGLRGSLSGGLLLRGSEYSRDPTPTSVIDCALCVPKCPVNAIFAEDDLPADQNEFLQLNAELAAIWPNIVKMKAAPSDAEQWNNVPGKRKLLER